MKKYNPWEKLYKNSKHISVWPWNDVIKIIKKNYKGKNKNILELGCGVGANIPFLIKEKFNYTGIDYSKNAVKLLKKKFPSIKKGLICSDIKNFDYKNLKKKFGIILDRGTLTHLEDKEILSITNNLQDIITKNTLLILSSLYSDQCTGYQHEKTNFFSKGIFKGVGYINFFSKKKIVKLFNNWSIKYLEEVSYTNHFTKEKISYWNIVMKKK